MDILCSQGRSDSSHAAVFCFFLGGGGFVVVVLFCFLLLLLFLLLFFFFVVFSFVYQQTAKSRSDCAYANFRLYCTDAQAELGIHCSHVA